MILAKSFKETLSQFAFAGLYLITLQLPVGLLDVTDYMNIEKTWEVLLLTPIYFFLSSVCLIATFQAIENIEIRNWTTYSRLFVSMRPLFWKTFMASTLVSSLIILGIAALIIPGIWIAAQYAFVPLIIKKHPDFSVMQALHTSKMYYKRETKSLLLWVCLVSGINIFLFFVLGKSNTEFFKTSNILGNGLSFFLNLIVNCSTGAFFNVWLCNIFKHIPQEP